MSEISKSVPPSVSVKTEVRFFLVLTKGMYGITVVFEIGVLSVSFYLIASFFLNFDKYSTFIFKLTGAQPKWVYK